MSEDPLLSALGRAERDAQAIPERWRRLAEGRATEDELDALRREAARDEDAKLLWERFRPFDEAADRALAGRLAGGVSARPSAARRPRTGRAALGVFAAAAAALLFVLLVPRGEPRLPLYRIDTSESDLVHRGAAAEPPPAVAEQHTGSRLTLVLRPVERYEGPLAVDAHVLRGDGRAGRWNAPMTFAGTGAVRIEGTIAELLPGITGEVTLLLYVRAPKSEGAGQLFVHRLRIRAE